MSLDGRGTERARAVSGWAYQSCRGFAARARGRRAAGRPTGTRARAAGTFRRRETPCAYCNVARALGEPPGGRWSMRRSGGSGAG